jgi:hypothetical protein
MPELVTNGKTLLMVQRHDAGRSGLGVKQIAWCRQRWPWFETPRVIRLERKDGNV